MTAAIAKTSGAETAFTGDIKSSLFLNYFSLFVYFGLTALTSYLTVITYKNTNAKRLVSTVTCYVFLFIVTLTELTGYLFRICLFKSDSDVKSLAMGAVQQLMVIAPFQVFFPAIVFLVYKSMTALKCPSNTRATLFVKPAYILTGYSVYGVIQILCPTAFGLSGVSNVYKQIKGLMTVELVSMLSFVAIHWNFVSCYKTHFATELNYRAIDKKWQIFNISLGVAEISLIFRAFARILNSKAKDNYPRTDNNDYWLFVCESLPVAVSVFSVLVAIPAIHVFSDFSKRFDNNDNENNTAETKRATSDEVFDLDE